MSSLRVTNYLLAFIALCLAALAVQRAPGELLPAAVAQSRSRAEVLLYACGPEPGYTAPRGCQPTAVRVNASGELITAKQ